MQFYKNSVNSILENRKLAVNKLKNKRLTYRSLFLINTCLKYISDYNEEALNHKTIVTT
ncbi:hypothetical protein J2Z57_000409 [Formosa algae]|uniref:Uncharacterized protein n=1 Tax=Formosa algae TaxID=225843 RepID=A0A9X1CBH2_9FLAO|nr:hypothetical protein [Formosa algae]MDQ0333987.1 hypothetical protein [Formosa algae]